MKRAVVGMKIDGKTRSILKNQNIEKAMDTLKENKNTCRISVERNNDLSKRTIDAFEKYI